MTVSIFGVRHHGPGSARSLGEALGSMCPDIVLIEGPPEGNAIVGLAGEAEMRPPVALLAYSPEHPRKAVFYPFASFSPEWIAIRYALDRAIPVRFIDLPAATLLAQSHREKPGSPGVEQVHESSEAELDQVREDPLRFLAEAAGYDDPERWWEDMVEHRPGGAAAFEAIAEAMAALREQLPAWDPRDAENEARREASMRRGIREAAREGFGKVAVVCGAWHVPALNSGHKVSEDEALLRKLPRVKVFTTWVPWTHGRLALSSGYGAGISSPGWYHHLFVSERDAVSRWMVRVARLLREQDHPGSSAHAIEAVQLSEFLATLRGRPLAGLNEVNDATRAVFGQGGDVEMALLREKLIVGEELGRIPPSTPMVALQQDLEKHQKRLRLKPEASRRELDLDLRRPVDLDRSHLLHRLKLLGIGWGRLARPQGYQTRSGTFHERWVLQWQPELSVALIEAGVWGTTIAEAAAGAGLSSAERAPDLGSLTALLEGCLLADLPSAVGGVMKSFSNRVATDTDVVHLMEALPPLARVVRYGSVRRSDASAVGRIAEGLAVRVSLGLPLACSSLDDDAAAAMLERVSAVHDAIATLGRDDLTGSWNEALHRLTELPQVHSLISARAVRFLFDAGSLSRDDVARKMRFALSRPAEAASGAAWIEGFLGTSALVLVYDETLLGLLDDWIRSIKQDAFVPLLPMLRRTFSRFPATERRMLGERVVRVAREGRASSDDDIDTARAQKVIPVLARLLGAESALGGD